MQNIIKTKPVKHKMCLMEMVQKNHIPSVSKYKQILPFRYIQLMMYVVHNIDYIHH